MNCMDTMKLSRTMDSFSMEICLHIVLLMAWCVLAVSEPGCDQTEFLHTNGTCVECPVCGPGEQLSQDCGFGDGGEGLCIACPEGQFSPETGLDPCWRCTQCSLLNRQQRAACSAVSNALCGHCLPGYYELRSMTGEVELACVPCNRHSRATVRKECLALNIQASKTEIAVTMSKRNMKDLTEERTKTISVSMVLVGSATACSTFLLILLLWAFLLAFERFKQVPEYWPEPEGLFSRAEPDCLQHSTLPSHSETAVKWPEARSLMFPPAEDPPRGHENEVQPASIVINVTTNIKPSGQNAEDNLREGREGGPYSMGEMEQKLHKIWEVAQGQGIDMLDYDTVQDLSLLLGSTSQGSMLRRLGRSLGVPPQVIVHLHGFQDLFQYLRTSTYMLLPQLAQAAALLPSPEVVARIHRAVVNK